MPVTINGSPQKFLLDIGMKRPTAVSPELMAKLGLPELNPNPTQFGAGTSGAARMGNGNGGDYLNVRVCDLRSGLCSAERGDRVRVGAFGVGNATGRHLQFAVAQKGEPRVEAAPRMGLQPRPAVDHHQPPQPVTRLERDRHTDHPADRMTDEMRAIDADRIHQRDYVVRHVLDAHHFRQHSIAAAGAAMIVEQDPEALREGIQIGPPIICGSAEAG